MQRRDLLKVMASGAFASLAGCSAPSTGSSRTDLAWLDAISQADLVASGALEAVDLVLAAAERLASVNSKLNAVTFKDIDRAVDAAPAAKGLLGGVPTLLKDLNSYPDMPWTRGSRLFAEALGEPVSAYTQRLLDAGLVVLGKTNTPEFGLLPTTEPLLHGPTRNPWNLNHSAGGSSGGAAAAVAAGIVPFAQCGDGGGSIRIPAALCGVFGLKPSRGRFPDQGYGEQAWPISIRHVISRTVRDSALVLALTERSDDSELLPVGFVEPSRVRPKRIALTIDSFYGPPDDETRAAVEATATRLAARGHAVEPVVDTPLTDGRFAEDFLTLWQATAGSIAALVQQKTNMPPEETGLLEPFTLGLAAAWRKRDADALPIAIAGLTQYQRAVREFLHGYDAWLTPVTPSPAPPIGELAPDVAFETLLERVSPFAAYTPIHNAAGTPALSIPAAMSATGLPIGAQLAAAHGQEALLLSLAYQLEEAAPWRDSHPRMHA